MTLVLHLTWELGSSWCQVKKKGVW